MACAAGEGSLVWTSFAAKAPVGFAHGMLLRVPFSAGTPGTPDDVTVFAGNCPAKFRTSRVEFHVTTGIALATLQLRTAAGGGGSAASSAVVAAVAGVEVDTQLQGATVRVFDVNDSLYVRRSNRGVAGELWLTCVPEV